MELYEKFLVISLILGGLILSDYSSFTADNILHKAETDSPLANLITTDFETKAQKQAATTITEKLLNSDSRPMPKADVHLLRFNQSEPLASVQAAEDGSFKIETNESGLFTLQFTGANHKSGEVVLLIEKPVRVEINARLKTYDYAANFSIVKIIGDFNDFKFSSAKAMEKQPDGTFTAEFDAIKGDKFSYQLLSITTGGGSVNGTQSNDYIYDGGGDYRSVVSPQDGKVKIVFDPRLLIRSNAQAKIVFGDANSVAARTASVYEAMLKRRGALQKATTAHKKTGTSLDEFSYDWSPALMILSKQIAREKNPTLRQGLLMS